MAEFIWRVREDLVSGAFPRPDEAVRQVRAALRRNATPIVVGDYSDRSGDATPLLAELIRLNVPGVLYGTLRDENVIEALTAQGAGVGDAFAMNVGGFAGPASGEPVRVEGTLAFFGAALGFDQVAVVEHGTGSALIITPALVQITEPERLAIGPLDPDAFDVFVVKSRVHFRRGFDETGYARTIIVADAPGPFVGTIHLDALPYEHVDLSTLYPYGAVGR